MAIVPAGVSTRYCVETPMYARSDTVPVSDVDSVVADAQLLGPHADRDASAHGRQRRCDVRLPPAVEPHRPCAATRRREQIGDAEEAGDEGGARTLVELARVAQLLDVAVAHDRDRVGHRHRLLLVVRDVDEGDADLALDPLQLELHLLAELEVERPERFVEQEHARVIDECPGERDPLLLAARELCRLALLDLRETDELEHLADLPLQVVAADSLAPQPEGDVLEDREVREERVGLEHRVDVTLVGRQLADVAVAEQDRGPSSVPRSRRSCGASSSCRSRRARAERRSCLVGIARSIASTATTSSKRFVSFSSRTSAEAASA